MSATSTKPKSITAEEFDRRADAGEDLSDYLDWSKATRPGLESQRINVDLPIPFLQNLDREAELRGITRQSLIKAWLFDRLQAPTKPAKNLKRTRKVRASR